MMLSLFLRFLLIGAMAFGGGYAVLPLVQQQCVEITGWLTMGEYSDLLTISQITPGPIAIDAAAFVGMKVGGVLGAVVASFGFMLPPFVIVTLLYILFRRYGRLDFMQNILSGLKPAVVGLIAVAAADVTADALWGNVGVSLASTDWFAAVLAVAAFIVLRRWKVSVIGTIAVCGVIGVLQELAATYLL